MKKRKLLTDIFTVVLMLAIVLVILAYLNVFPGKDVSEKGSLNYAMLTYVGMPLALLSVLLIDLIFPLIDNRARLREPVFVIKVVLKALLFIAAVVVGILFFVVDIEKPKNEFLRVGIFCALYFAQFLINLDPPLRKKKEAEATKEDEDEYEEFDEDEEDFDDDFDDDDEETEKK
jgi:uncharacterized membrane protein